MSMVHFFVDIYFNGVLDRNTAQKVEDTKLSAAIGIDRNLFLCMQVTVKFEK